MVLLYGDIIDDARKTPIGAGQSCSRSILFACCMLGLPLDIRRQCLLGRQVTSEKFLNIGCPLGELKKGVMVSCTKKRTEGGGNVGDIVNLRFGTGCLFPVVEILLFREHRGSGKILAISEFLSREIRTGDVRWVRSFTGSSIVLQPNIAITSEVSSSSKNSMQ